MRRGEMTLDRLVRLLLALPTLPSGELCVECEDHGFKEVAVIREPMGGEYLCAGCAVTSTRGKTAQAKLTLNWRCAFDDFLLSIQRNAALAHSLRNGFVAIAQRRSAKNTRSISRALAAHAMSAQQFLKRSMRDEQLCTRKVRKGELHPPQ